MYRLQPGNTEASESYAQALTARYLQDPKRMPDITEASRPQTSQIMTNIKITKGSHPRKQRKTGNRKKQQAKAKKTNRKPRKSRENCKPIYSSTMPKEVWCECLYVPNNYQRDIQRFSKKLESISDEN